MMDPKVMEPTKSPMMPKFTPKNRLRKYSQERLAAALEELKSQNGKKGTSIRAIAKKYNLPSSTIWGRLYSANPTSVRMGRRPILTEEEENALERWILDKASIGEPYRSVDLRLAVKRILDNDPTRETTFKGNLPGKGWINSFMRRHPAIKRGKHLTRAAVADGESRGGSGQPDTTTASGSSLPVRASVSERANALGVLESLMKRVTLSTYQKIYGLGVSLPTDELYNIWKDLKDTSQPLPRMPSNQSEQDGQPAVSQPTERIGMITAKKRRDRLKAQMRAKEVRAAKARQAAAKKKPVGRRARGRPRGGRAQNACVNSNTATAGEGSVKEAAVEVGEVVEGDMVVEGGETAVAVGMIVEANKDNERALVGNTAVMEENTAAGEPVVVASVTYDNCHLNLSHQDLVQMPSVSLQMPIIPPENCGHHAINTAAQNTEAGVS